MFSLSEILLLRRNLLRNVTMGRAPPCPAVVWYVTRSSFRSCFSFFLSIWTSARTLRSTWTVKMEKGKLFKRRKRRNRCALVSCLMDTRRRPTWVLILRSVKFGSSRPDRKKKKRREEKNHKEEGIISDPRERSESNALSPLYSFLFVPSKKYGNAYKINTFFFRIYIQVLQ